MSQESPPNILILAGQREGRVDPLAAYHGLAYKCLVPLLGRPLIAHVLDIVETAFPGAPIIVSINDPAVLDGETSVRRLADGGRLSIVKSRHTLLDSVLAAAEHAAFPLLITTADNVLMTPEALRGFDAFASTEAVDGAALFARKEDVLAAHPEGQPRFWRFRDGEFSGCNTFWVKDREALVAAEIFRHGGQFLKFPKRFIAAFGLSNLIGFRLRLFKVDDFLRRLSRRFGKRMKVKIVGDGRLAIDVDTRLSHQVAERLLTS